MIHYFFRLKIQQFVQYLPSEENISRSSKCLFSLFTRYGDTIIDLVVIKEFIKQYPDKYYTVLCPKQMVPYVNEILPNIKVVSINKRNVFDMLKVHFFLKQKQFDIGFNPWSNGDESCFFLTYCRYFLCYRNMRKKHPVNHYEVVRDYLRLPHRPWHIHTPSLAKEYRHVLICPQSTDIQRSMSVQELRMLLAVLKQKYTLRSVTIASMDDLYFQKNCEWFRFSKTADSSRDFLALVKSMDIVFCVDSGPLHIATALNIEVVALFRTTTPEIVLNSESKVYISTIASICEGKW